MFPYIKTSDSFAREQPYSITGSSWRGKTFSIPEGLATPKANQFALVFRTNQRSNILEICIVDGIPGYFYLPTCISQHPDVHGGPVMNSGGLCHGDRINQIVHIPFKHVKPT